MSDPQEPTWLDLHRYHQPYREIMDPLARPHSSVLTYSRDPEKVAASPAPPLLADKAFNNHNRNDGRHVSPYDEGRVDIGTDNLVVTLIQGVNEESLKDVLSRALQATTGIHPDDPGPTSNAVDEMFRGGLQAALESQVLVFQVTGASRALTHQIVRSRRAGFHQQSQRATWYGDRPNVRWPESVLRAGSNVSDLWKQALLAAWAAYKAACDAGVSYQDARYILPEGTTNYILCEYSIREFINVFAYRGCSMFLWEMVHFAREARRVLLEAHPFLEPYVKISCEKPVGDCPDCLGYGFNADPVPEGTPEDSPLGQPVKCTTCGGDGKARRCTFQGWENVEGQCDFPWARQDNRVFLPSPEHRIGAG